MLPNCVNVDTRTGEEPFEDYLRRLLLLARELPRIHAGRTVVCFSHAASVGLVAALTREAKLVEAGTFAPCGIWKLTSADDGATWTVEQRGEDNSGHVRVHAWNDATNQWDQRGQDIDGEGDNDYSAQYPIDLSDDGTVVAIGAHANSPPGKAGAGHARPELSH